MAPSSRAIIGCRAAARCRGEGGTSPADLKIGDEALRDWWRHFADAFNVITFHKLYLVHPWPAASASLGENRKGRNAPLARSLHQFLEPPSAGLLEDPRTAPLSQPPAVVLGVIRGNYYWSCSLTSIEVGRPRWFTQGNLPDLRSGGTPRPRGLSPARLLPPPATP